MPGASGHRKFFRSFFSYSTCEGTRESSKIPSLHLLFFDLWARVITSALNVFLLPRSSFFFFLSRNNKSTLFSDTLKSGKLRKREGEILILFLPNGYSPTPRYDAQLSPAMSAMCADVQGRVHRRSFTRRPFKYGYKALATANTRRHTMRTYLRRIFLF